MNVKRKIRNSWKNPDISNICYKKDQLTFESKKHLKVSLRVFVLSLSSLIIIFSSAILFTYRYYNNKNSIIEQPVSFEFGALNPLDLKMKPAEINKVSIKNLSYYNVRGNFSLWFNNLDIKKAKVDYSKIDLMSYIANIEPVCVGVKNEEYNLYFTSQNYLIVLYEEIYVMYDLVHADILLNNFESSF